MQQCSVLNWEFFSLQISGTNPVVDIEPWDKSCTLPFTNLYGGVLCRQWWVCVSKYTSYINCKVAECFPEKLRLCSIEMQEKCEVLNICKDLIPCV